MVDHPASKNTLATLPATTDRRRFLTGLGFTTCAGFIVAEKSSVPASAADQRPGPKAKRPAPASGIAGVKELLGRKEPLTWVFTGDSITHGALHTKGWRSYPEHFAERVRWELKRMRDIVVNTGISGDRAQGLLPDIDWRVLHLKPDVVSVML